jgi:S-adenosylmethionine hydrolase
MSSPPIITLTTDFGLADIYVAALKGAILRHSPSATLIDITHAVPRHDVFFGSICLERAVASFDAGTMHLAVVDPGVGGDRRILVVQIRRSWIICPDNGLITWAWRRLGPGEASELIWRPRRRISGTFHGRDIMAPAAAMIAHGKSLRKIARTIHDPILLDLHPAAAPAKSGRIIHVDHFGNATTNIPREAVGPNVSIRVRGKRLGLLKRTYVDVEPGRALALIGSSDLLEIAVREGSAAKKLSLRLGDKIFVD